MQLADLEEKLNLPSKTHLLQIDESADYQVFIKREDLIHPFLSGNKWRKLKYNIAHYLESDYDGILSLGGPFSNHLVALSVISKALNIPCEAFVRGASIDANNPSLTLCKAHKMNLLPLSKDHYAERDNLDFLLSKSSFERPFFVPEGGSNHLSYRGCSEVLDELNFTPDFVVMPIGTAGTAAAICQTLDSNTHLIGISPFKKDKVNIPFLSEIKSPHEVMYNFCGKGYGRYSPQLVRYINDFWNKHNIPLDPIYNAKGMMALESLVAQRYFPQGSKIVYIHTGGLQGIAGFNMLHGHKSIIQIPRNIYFPVADL